MVVGDDVGGLGSGGDVFDAVLPGGQFPLVVEIVVAVVAIVGIEPLLVVASVQAHVGDGRGNVLGGSKRAAQHRLIDVTEGDIFVAEIRQRLGVVPTGVADFDDARIFDELAQQAVEILAVQRCVFER